MRRTGTLLCIGLALALAACGGDGSGEATVEGPCEEAAAPAPKEVDLDRPPPRPPAGKLAALVETTCGSFQIALATEEAPKTTASFIHLAKNGVYDNTAIHRIALAPPVIQGGDPSGSGFGDAGYTIDEPPPPGTAYTRGVVAMGKSPNEPPGRSGSQFFVVTAADAGLPLDYALVGRVTSGFHVVTTISQFGDLTGQSEAPVEPVVIKSVTIQGGGP